MSYHIYTSEGIVFKKRDIGEADKVFSVFTKDFGRVEVRARGIRHLKSKLRYHFSEFSIIRITFVGASNEYWRLIDAEELEVFDNLRKNVNKARCISSIFSLFERLVQGQEEDMALWEKLKKVFYFLERENLDQGDLKKLEKYVSDKIINHLGYHTLEQSML